MKKKIFYVFFLVLMSAFTLYSSCRHSVSPDLSQLTANAGPDQIINVGQYVILDGNGSTRGDGDTLNYQWTADANNPMEVFFQNSEPKTDVGFTKEGVYKFRLVVNNGINDSRPDEVVITVRPRTQFIFNDPVLEINVRHTLKIPTTDITPEQLLMLDTLVAGGVFGKITSLNGIEQCTNLECLNLSLHQLTDISPIAQLKKLSELELDQNRTIADISPLSNLTNLVKLNIESNNIVNISPLKNLTKLTFLGLLGNPVKDISPLKDIVNLNELWLGQYGRESFPVSGLSVISKFTKLSLLWISDYNVGDISFVSTLNKLQYLRLSFCNISDIEVLVNCSKLERLYLDSNNITDITSLEKLEVLNIVDLNYNKIIDILPLVNNVSFAKGDGVSLIGNPLDSISINQYIPELQSRGVMVFW